MKKSHGVYPCKIRICDECTLFLGGMLYESPSTIYGLKKNDAPISSTIFFLDDVCCKKIPEHHMNLFSQTVCGWGDTHVFSPQQNGSLGVPLEVGLFAHLFVLHTFSGWHRATLVVSWFHLRSADGSSDDFFLMVNTWTTPPKKERTVTSFFFLRRVFFWIDVFSLVKGDVFWILSYGFLRVPPWDFPKIL